MAYVRYRKVAGKHRMYCPVRKRPVVLGKDCEDGDIAYLDAFRLPSPTDQSWQKLDDVDEEEVLAEEVGEPDGTLVVVPKGGGWFNVQNTATGDFINTSALRLKDAEALISRFSTQPDLAGEDE